MLGALNHSQSLGVIKQSACLLLSSLSEGCPLVILEAMALGKPVIAPDVGGIKDIINDDNGFLFPVNRQDIFCDLIMLISENDRRSFTMGLNGSKTISDKYNLDKVIEKYIETYKTPGLTKK